MSGIYIKGVEMPTSCFDCKMRTAVGCCGNLPHNTRMPNCPIFSVSEGQMNDAVVHGHWIYCKGSNGKDYRKCSVCLHTQEITGVLNYCPICGTRMGEVVE